MTYVNRQFGKREPRLYHGSIPLNARRRVHCAVVKRVNRVIYFEIAEAVQVPFFFRIDFDYDATWIDCEFISQKSSTIAAQIITASFDAANARNMDQPASSAADLDQLAAWCGAKK